MTNFHFIDNSGCCNYVQHDRRKHRIKRILLSILLFFPLSIFAALSDPNWITVEIILFEPTNLAPGMQEENWPIRPGLPSFTNAIELNTNESYTTIPKNQWQLNESERKLTNSGQYRVLSHTAWKQPLLGPKTAIPIHLKAGRQWDTSLPNFSGETISWEIEGTLKLYNARFIHADADFILQLPATSASVSDDFNTMTYHTLTAVNPDNWRPRTKTRLQYFRLTHTERIKAKEIYYFDHPLLGLIIRIS